jgi:dTDP-4-dehydrorhamnose reductase
MILLIGSTGYVGSQFVFELTKRQIDFVSIGRDSTSSYDLILKNILDNKVEFVINAAGYVGKPNVDACESYKGETIEGNIVLPTLIAVACREAGINWGHVTSGCIYLGDNGGNGFTEDDDSNFCFSETPCSFYSGTKALSEKIIGEFGNCYLWRLRVPFDHIDGPRNYLTKIMSYDKLLKARNSLSHRGDFVKACLDLVEQEAPLGIYNVTNPGSVTTEEVVGLIKDVLLPDRDFKYYLSDEEFYKENVAPRSSCVLNTNKLESSGVKIRPVLEALEDSLKRWGV